MKKKEEDGRFVLVTLQPNLRKTPRGGRMMARRMSMQFAVPSSAIFFFGVQNFKETVMIILHNVLRVKSM
jgi:hypothetical protein